MVTTGKTEYGFTLEVSRRFPAAPEQVFDAWLDPDSVCRWLFATPDGVMERIEIEPRVGGTFRIEERRGDTLAQHFGEYLEIERPRRLVFTFSTEPEETPSVVRVQISPDETGGSVLHLSHEMPAQWADYEDRIRDGWTKILQGLADYVAAA